MVKALPSTPRIMTKIVQKLGKKKEKEKKLDSTDVVTISLSRFIISMYTYIVHLPRCIDGKLELG